MVKLYADSASATPPATASTLDRRGLWSADAVNSRPRYPKNTNG